MSYIENTIAVLCGGAAGAVCRFKLNAAIMSGLTMAFPLGILCINVLGGFLMGLLQGAMKRSGKPFTVGYSLLGTGFLGGFTHRRRIRNRCLPSQENRGKDPVIGRVFVLSLFPTLNLRNRGTNRFEKAILTKAKKLV